MTHKTAIQRTKLSLPARYLSREGLLRGRCLDYGCGRGFDADNLCIRGYDPYWRPYKNVLIPQYYHTVMCNYVLNVVGEAEREDILDEIFWLLAPNGIAYISVRRDRAWLNGGSQIKGETCQEYVQLNENIVLENTRFCMYSFSRK